MTHRKTLLVAALLASSPALAFDEADGLSVKAGFPQTARVNASGELLTDQDFRIKIERVEFQSDNIDLQARDEAQLERILTLNHISTPQTELVVRGARVHGRIFDASAEGRLPEDGVGISGELPVEVVVTKSHDHNQPLSVRFEVPAFFFEGVDWSSPA